MHDSLGPLSDGLAGGIAGKIIAIRHDVLTDIIVGVAGNARLSISSPPWSVRRRFSISVK